MARTGGSGSALIWLGYLAGCSAEGWPADELFGRGCLCAWPAGWLAGRPDWPVIISGLFL